MKAEFKIYKGSGCTLDVMGQEVANSTYVTTTSAMAGEYTFMETLVIDALYKVNSSEEETLLNVVICTHEQSTVLSVTYNVPDTATFDLDEDGLYKIVHMIVPLKDWVTNYVALTGSDPTSSKVNYVSDGTKFYTYDSGVYTSVPITDVLNNYAEDDLGEYNTLYSEQYTFSTCKIDKCLFKINNELLHKYCPMSCNKDELSDLILKRDILWMATHVVGYLLELGSFIEAQRIIENFNGCHSFCNDDTNGNGGSGCGCGSINKK